jgi:hypothetical protein
MNFIETPNIKKQLFDIKLKIRKMKNQTKFFALAIVMLAFTASTFAQVTASATATATVVTPIGISKTVDMNFGNVAASVAAGTVVLATDGSRTATGGVTIPTSGVGTAAAASFTVTGQGTYTFVITLPSTDYTITDGTHNMIVNTFTSNPSGTGTLVAGSKTLLVGATLNVGISQAAGVYTNGVGFDVTVNYN